MRTWHRRDDPDVPAVARWPARRTALFVVLAGATVTLAACSSSSSPATTTTTQASPTTTGGSTSTTVAPSSTTTTTGPKTTGCPTANLTVTFGSPNGTAGAIHYLLTFHNGGTSSCTMFGYPGVSFLTAAGSQIGAPAVRTTGVGVASIPVAAGSDAYASVSVTDPGIPPCTSEAQSTQVRVYPPGQTQAVTVAAPGVAVCSSPNTSAYQSAIIGPVVSTAP